MTENGTQSDLLFIEDGSVFAAVLYHELSTPNRNQLDYSG